MREPPALWTGAVDEGMSQTPTRALTGFQVPTVDDREPEAARWQRMARDGTVLMKSDLQAGDAGHLPEFIDQPPSRMPVRTPVGPKQHDAVAEARPLARAFPHAVLIK